MLLLPQLDRDYIHFEDGDANPFDRDARKFSRRNAWWLADAALLAYWNEGPARPIWARAGFNLEFVEEEGVQCHVGSTHGLVIVAFRGTQPNDVHDLVDIARVRRRPWEFGGAVHEGFLSAHARIWPQVEQMLRRLDPAGDATWFTGHSMGAALAALSMDRWSSARGLYTIGSPAIGDRPFATRFDGRHRGRCFRYVNYRDLVVYAAGWLSVLIGNYTHIKELRYIDAQGSISSGRPSLGDWLSFFSTRGLVSGLAKHIEAGQLVFVPDPLIDHTPRRYAVHIWNDYDANRR